MSQPEHASIEGRKQTMHTLRDAEPAARSEELAVIVEIEKDGAARIRQCPPGVVVVVAHRSEITDEDDQEEHHRKRSMAAGKRNGAKNAPELDTGSLAGIRQIPVEFPG